MARKQSRWTPPRPGWPMERHIADVCACLKRDVDLMPREVLRSESNGVLLPVPWIAVSFRAETNKKSNDNANANLHNAQHSNILAYNSNTINSNTAEREASNTIDCCDATMRRVCDKLVAIRFLSVIACCPEYSWRGNPRFWWHVLHNICDSPHCDVYFSVPRTPPSRHRQEPPNCAPARGCREVNAMPKFELIFPSMTIKNEMLELCAQAFSSTPTEIFQRVDRRIQDVLTRLEVDIPQQPRKVKIDLNFSSSRLRMIHCMDGMRSLLAAGRGIPRNLPKVLFTIQCLDLSGSTIFERDLALLAQIVAHPALAVSELKMNWVFTANTPKRYMRAFCEFVAASFAISLSEVPVTTSLTKLCLESSTLNDFQLASLFSAIHSGTSGRGIRELSLQGLKGNNSWLWLAFGIFHPEAKSPISFLDLSYCVLRPEDVDRVRNLLESTDYSPFLLDNNVASESVHSSRSSRSEWVLLATGTRLELPHDRKKHFRGRPMPALKLQAELWCKVLESWTSWTSVMVPAYGRLCVKNSKIIRTETRARTNYSCLLKTLTMVAVKTASHVLTVDDNGELRGSLGAQPVDRVLSEWVKVVGQSLETLHLRRNPLRTGTLAVVLEACPLLRDLDVSGCELNDIAPFTRAFRSERCILRTLKAAQNHVSVRSQEELFGLLGDPGCDSARNLEVLHLEENPTSPTNRSLNVLYSALRKNWTLRYLELTMDEKHSLSENLRYRFNRDHHNKWLGHESLPSECRLASLSVSLVKALPTAVIEIILEFARRDVYRQVFWA